MSRFILGGALIWVSIYVDGAVGWIMFAVGAFLILSDTK